jgi:non-ribosomal peptide synthetase component F
MTLLGGWAALLARLSGQSEVVIGSPVANRRRSEVEPLIGLFVNTLALRIDLSGLPTVGELLGRVKAQALAAQENQDLPFEQVVEIMQPPRSLAHAPIFQAMFAWQNMPEGELNLHGLALTPLALPHVTTQFDLSLSLQESGERIVGYLEYATSLFDRETIQRYLGHWRRLLSALVAGGEQAVDRLPLLNEVELRQILIEWNAPQADYSMAVSQVARNRAEKRVHDLFEDQAEKRPEAIALCYEEQNLSYGELNAQANRLAHHLRGLDVRTDSRVAICMRRSIEMMVALLATLRPAAFMFPWIRFTRQSG